MPSSTSSTRRSWKAAEHRRGHEQAHLHDPHGQEPARYGRYDLQGVPDRGHRQGLPARFHVRRAMARHGRTEAARLRAPVRRTHDRRGGQPTGQEDTLPLADHGRLWHRPGQIRKGPGKLCAAHYWCQARTGDGQAVPDGHRDPQSLAGPLRRSPHPGHLPRHPGTGGRRSRSAARQNGSGGQTWEPTAIAPGNFWS